MPEPRRDVVAILINGGPITPLQTALVATATREEEDIAITMLLERSLITTGTLPGGVEQFLSHPPDTLYTSSGSHDRPATAGTIGATHDGTRLPPATAGHGSPGSPPKFWGLFRRAHRWMASHG